MKKKKSKLAIASMILGILGPFTIGLTAIPAVIFGHTAKRAIKRKELSGKKMAVTGLVLGYILIAYWIISLALAFMFSTGVLDQKYKENIREFVRSIGGLTINDLRESKLITQELPAYLGIAADLIEVKPESRTTDVFIKGIRDAKMQSAIKSEMKQFDGFYPDMKPINITFTEVEAASPIKRAGIYVPYIGIKTDLPRDIYWLEAVPNMCQVRKIGEPVFVIYPHYPGYSINKEYPNLPTIGMMGKNKDIPVFTVSNDKFEKFLVDAPVTFELIIDVSQKAKVQPDIDLFLETMSSSKHVE